MGGETTDLRAELEAQFDAAESAPAATAADPAPTAAPVGNSSAAPETAAPSSPSTDDGRPRDAQGRFIRADGTPEPAATAAAPAPDATKEAAPEAGAAQPQAPAAATDDRPPVGLSAGIKGQWEKLPSEVRAEFIKREDDFHRGLDQYRQGHAMSQAWQQAVQPYMATIQSLGATPMQAVQVLFNADHQLRYSPPAQKAQIFAYLAQQYGVDLGQVPQGAEQPQVDPVVAQLQQQVYGLTQRLESGQQQQVQAVQQEVQTELEQFAADPKNRFFPDVKHHMGVLIKEGIAESLADAYDKACRLHPEVSKVLLAQQQADLEAKRIADAQKNVAHAKRAGFDVSGQGSAATQGNSNLSLRDELAAQFG